MKEKTTILIYGYGNEGREDDALGTRLVEELASWVEKEQLTHISLEKNFQLNEQDAELISLYDMAIFVDATSEAIPHFSFKPVTASFDHPTAKGKTLPAYVLAMCQQLFGKYPEVYALHLKGYEWEMKETLTGPADVNLQMALVFLKELLLVPERRFDLLAENYI